MKEMSTLFEQVCALNTKFIVVTGGVCSSLGKGVLISSVGVLLKNAGYSVTVVKWDPYLNVDPGTMSPTVHGEVFVTDDGAETDLDLGHYERMLGVHLTKESSVSSGQIYQEILEGERTGKYLGRCIQMIPHVTDAIKARLMRLALSSKAEYVLIEIGGTVGDIEGEVFLEAVRELKMDLDHRLMHCHLSFVPFLTWSQEYKTKPTQHSVMLLKRAGLVPDALFLRSDGELTEKSVKKISVMCGVPHEYIFQVINCDPIYQLFHRLQDQLVGQKIQQWFGYSSARSADLSQWTALIEKIRAPRRPIRIGMVVKYIGTDPYISVIKAIESAAWACNRELDLVTIQADELEDKTTQNGKDAWNELESVDGVVVPGGFDVRGLQGKIDTVTWARESRVPYLGLCLGMQVMLIEFARSLASLADASSTEVAPQASVPLISLLEEQREVTQLGASMRLGAFECTLLPGSKAHAAYGQDKVRERHRHRYEFNNAYRAQLEQAGVVFSGLNKELDLVEIAELKDHPFMVASQFHPEFLSTPLKPHPLFLAHMKASVVKKAEKGGIV